jgi:hypothetical protein
MTSKLLDVLCVTYQYVVAKNAIFSTTFLTNDKFCEIKRDKIRHKQLPGVHFDIKAGLIDNELIKR